VRGDPRARRNDVLESSNIWEEWLRCLQPSVREHALHLFSSFDETKSKHWHPWKWVVLLFCYCTSLIAYWNLLQV
jgi:hypothetical protein